MFKVITIQFNERCCIRCPYCFAGNHELRSSETKLSHENFERFFQFCVSNEIEMVRVTGGEPFLHPEAIHMLEKLKYFKLNILTNLVVPGCVERMNPIKGQAAFLVNINDRGCYTENQWKSLMQNISELKKRKITTVFGYNVYKKDFDMTTVIRLARELKCERLRMSIANPSLDGSTTVLQMQEIAGAAHKLTEISRKLSDEGIEAFFDCPIAPCLMYEEDYEYMYLKGRIRNQCSSMVFVESDLRLGHCYTTDSMHSLRWFKDCEDYESAVRVSATMLKEIQEHTPKWEKCNICTNRFKAAEICGCFANYYQQGWKGNSH